MANIRLIRGDSKTYDITIKDGDGVAIDITGYTIFFTVKTSIDNNLTDTTAVIKKTITSHINPTEGKTQISLTEDDTNIEPCVYYYDIQLKSIGGDIKTPSEYPARFTILGDVTRRTS